MSRLIVALAFSTLLFAPGTAAQGEIRTVVLSGQPALGAKDGEVFRSISPRFHLNDNGLTSFHARLSAVADLGKDNRGDSSIWIEKARGRLQLVLRAGELVPVGDKHERFSGFSGAKLSNDGDLSFFASSLSDQGSRDGFWFKPHDSRPQPVARQYEIAPGTDGARFDRLSRMFALANKAGQTAFVGKLDSASPGVTEGNDSGLWVQDDLGVLQLVAREGTTKGLSLPDDGRRQLSINDLGDVVFGSIERGHHGRMRGRNVLRSNISIVVRGAVFTILQRDDPIEMSPGDVFRISYSSNPSINNSGEIAFFGGAKSEGRRGSDIRAYMVLHPEDGLRVVAASGTQAPGMLPGVKFGFNLSPGPYIGGGGDVVFTSNVGASGRDYQFGIWAERDRKLGLVAIYGGDAPGTNGATFGVSEEKAQDESNSGGKDPFGLVAINANGQVAFTATLSDSFADVNDENDEGIWAEATDRTLHLIVREGDEIQVAPNDVRKVKSVKFVGSTGNEDGRPSGFNDRGELAFHAKFMNGSEGIFVSNLASASAVGPTEKNEDKAGSGLLSNADLVDRRLNDLERRILEESTKLRKRDENSDSHKLKQIASSLRSEYRANDARLQSLRQQLATNDDLKLVHNMEAIVGRQNVLALYWQELGTRIPKPVSNVLQPPSTDLMRDAAKFMRKHGEDEAIRARLAELMDKLYDYDPIRVEQNVPDRRARFLLGRRAVSSAFAGAIGPEPRPSVIGKTATLVEPNHPDETVDRLGLENGPIQTVSDEFRRLLKLQWHNGNLTIDRQHWDAHFELKTRKDIVRDVDHMLSAKGVSDDLLTPDEEGHLPLPLRHIEGQPNVALLFGKLAAVATKQFQPGGLSGGSGRSGDSIHSEFSCKELTADINVTPEWFRLTTDEHEIRRIVQVQGGVGGRLKILIQADKLTFLLQQSPGQRAEIVEITEDDIKRVKAPSFEELYLEHQEYVDTQIFPLLNYFGIITPFTRYNRFVVRSVLDQLHAANVDTKEADDLILALDDDSFNVRNNATKQLATDFTRYRNALEAALNDSSLSTEARSRIKKIVNSHRMVYAELEQFASSMKLSEDPAFLVHALQHATPADRSVIGDRLDEITGEAFGTNLTAWQAWIKSRGSSAKGR